jgi:hypothetical protein
VNLTKTINDSIKIIDGTKKWNKEQSQKVLK